MGQAELLPVNPKAGKYLLVVADAFGSCDAPGWLRSTGWSYDDRTRRVRFAFREPWEWVWCLIDRVLAGEVPPALALLDSDFAGDVRGSHAAWASPVPDIEALRPDLEHVLANRRRERRWLPGTSGWRLLTALRALELPAQAVKSCRWKDIHSTHLRRSRLVALVHGDDGTAANPSPKAQKSGGPPLTGCCFELTLERSWTPTRVVERMSALEGMRTRVHDSPGSVDVGQEDPDADLVKAAMYERMVAEVAKVPDGLRPTPLRAILDAAFLGAAPGYALSVSSHLVGANWHDDRVYQGPTGPRLVAFRSEWERRYALHQTPADSSLGGGCGTSWLRVGPYKNPDDPDENGCC